VSLKARLVATIGADGPLPVSVFMTLCLHDPELGYYATGAGLGRDFITAPETTQAFGELLGLWSVHEWQAMGAPEQLGWVELGPGRGTLMADALRATAGHPGFRAAASLALVEASPALREVQAGRLGGPGVRLRHVAGLEAVPAGPALILANEFLDCLPARQFVRDGGTWRERVVGLGADGGLAFGLAADTAPEAPASTGETVEVQPGLETLVATLAARAGPFRALFIDYGPEDGPPGDTLRAYRDGRQVDPLAAPGTCDLTVDVDFGRLARLARAAELDVHGPLAQGAFLMALGLQQRLDALIAANPGLGEALHAAARRLVDPAEMGTRFKAICLSSPGLPAPAGF